MHRRQTAAPNADARRAGSRHAAPLRHLGTVRELWASGEHRAMRGRFEVSVTICFANSEATIAETVASVAAQGGGIPFELLLVSNGTTDRSVAVAREAARGLPCRIVECESAGYDANARNVAIKEAGAEKILLVDSDDVLSPDYVARMSAALDRTPLVTGVWSLDRLNRDLFPEVADVIPRSAAHWPFRERGWTYAPTGTLGMRREVPERIGGFDPSLGVSCNNEWCFRAYAAGIETVAVLDAVLHYRLRRSAQAMFLQRYNWGLTEVAANGAAMAHGLPRRALHDAAGLRTLLGLGRGLLRLRSRYGRYNLAGLLGTAAGRLVGSIRHRRLDI